MITDTEIKTKGIHILAQYLGDVEAERFIALIQMDEKSDIEEISCRAMSLRNKNTEPGA